MRSHRWMQASLAALSIGGRRPPAAGSEPWAKEREKMRARAAHDAEGVLPLPDAAQLLPHGYLRRRLADGRFPSICTTLVPEPNFIRNDWTT